MTFHRLLPGALALALVLPACSDDPVQPGRGPMNIEVGGLDPEAPSFEDALAQAVPGDTITVAAGVRLTVAATQVISPEHTPILLRSAAEKDRGSIRADGDFPILRFEGAAPGTRIQYVDFSGNGDLLVVAGGNLTVETCDFTGGANALRGAGIVRCSGSLFSGGTTAVSMDGGSLHLENATVLDVSGDAVVLSSMSAHLRANLLVAGRILCGNAVTLSPESGCNDVWTQGGGSGWEGCTPGADDFNLDPQFCDGENGDYTLLSTSPCAPLNSPEGCGLIGARAVACDPVGP